MKNPLFYLLITLYALTACSNGEDYREPKSEEALSGLVLAASNGTHSNLSTIGFALGFVLMMVLDVVMG